MRKKKRRAANGRTDATAYFGTNHPARPGAALVRSQFRREHITQVCFSCLGRMMNVDNVEVSVIARDVIRLFPILKK